MEAMKTNAMKNIKSRTVTGAENPHARARKQRSLFIMGVFGIIALVFIFQIVHARIVSNSVNNKLAIETEHYSQLKDENGQLKNKVKLMNNEDYLEKLIRSKYLYTKKGETVYNLPKDAD